MLINSMKNGKVRLIMNLMKKRYRDKEKLFLVEGEHCVDEANKAGMLKEIAILEGYDFNFDVEKNMLTEEIMKECTTLITVPKIIGICYIEEKREIIGDKIILLDNVRDPGNVGTIIRSAKAFGITTVIFGDGCCDMYNPKVINATQGMIFNSNLIYKSTIISVEEIKKKDIKLIGTDVKEGKDLKEYSTMNKYAIILGNEGTGISSDILNLCDEKININIDKNVESLNVAVASSIIMYQLGE